MLQHKTFTMEGWEKYGGAENTVFAYANLLVVPPLLLVFIDFIPHIARNRDQ
jgi:hypothetical protein